MRIEAVWDPCLVESWESGYHEITEVQHYSGKGYVISIFSWGAVYYSLDDPIELAISKAIQPGAKRSPPALHQPWPWGKPWPWPHQCHSLTDAQGTLMQCYPGASSRVTGQGALNGTVVKPVPATSALPQVLSCHKVSDIQAFLCGYGVFSMARLFWLLALLWLKTWKGQRVRVPSFPSVLSKRAGV